jgi:hypothetical protein
MEQLRDRCRASIAASKVYTAQLRIEPNDTFRRTARKRPASFELDLALVIGPANHYDHSFGSMLANGCHLKRHEWSTAAEAIELHCRNNSFTLAGIQSNRRIQERFLRVVKSRSKS